MKQLLLFGLLATCCWRNAQAKSVGSAAGGAAALCKKCDLGDEGACGRVQRLDAERGVNVCGGGEHATTAPEAEYNVGGGLVEGDMLLPASRGAVKSEARKWKDAYVPYQISNRYTHTERAAIEAAMEHIMNHTCVRFAQRYYETDYLDIRPYVAGRCFTYLGFQPPSMQPHLVNLASECVAWQIGTAVHELMHALGFVHEQSRPDRDYNIYIAKENLVSGAYSQFQKSDYRSVDTAGTYYDFGSVMHYGTTAFSKNGEPTIVPRITVPSNVVVGQRTGMSENDISEINTAYNCNRG